MNQIPIIFAGTAEIAAPLLKSFAQDKRFDIKLVITQKNQPAGRKLQLISSPIKQVAKGLDLSIHQPENINDSESIKIIQKLQPQIMVVMAYGQILSPTLLSIPTHGCINVHASLLPKYRGASPIQSTLLGNEKETGISIMQMAEKMDTGPIFTQFKLSITPDDNAITLHDKLADLTAQKISDVLQSIIEKTLKAQPQEEDKATYSQKIAKANGLINWQEDAHIIANKIRAYAGWPSVYTYFNSKQLKIIKANWHKEDSNHPAGLVFQKDTTILIATGSGVLEPLQLKLEGKRELSVQDFVNGHRDFVGSPL